MGHIWSLNKFEKSSAFIDDSGVSISYGEMEKNGILLSASTDGRRLVAVLCTNSIGAAFGYVSFINNGIVPLMLSASLGRDLLDNLLRIYRPQYLWIPSGEKSDFKGKIVYEAYGYCLVKTYYMKSYPINDNLALLLTTSGSTGSPKFVRQSYENIKANTESIVEYLELDSSERPITTLPMNYTYGLSIINTHLAVGATILLTGKGLMQKEFWQFFKEQSATSFGGVPYTYEILDKLRFYRMDLPSLRTMTQAGGKLTPELQEKFAKYAEESGRKFVVMYGQCEATARMGYLPADKAVEKKGSMGIAIPGGRFKLVDEGGHEVTEPNIMGELVYEGANVTLGYAECGDDLMKGDERQGVLATGDMARFDEDGYYYIVGRKKRFLKIYGNRVNLDEMDRLIKGRFEIDVACAGVDDHMYIFIKDADLKEDVKEFASSKTGLNPAAFKVVVLNDIPKNDSGKTLYTELSKYYE